MPLVSNKYKFAVLLPHKVGVSRLLEQLFVGDGVGSISGDPHGWWYPSHERGYTTALFVCNPYGRLYSAWRSDEEYSDLGDCLSGRWLRPTMIEYRPQVAYLAYRPKAVFAAERIADFFRWMRETYDYSFSSKVGSAVDWDVTKHRAGFESAFSGSTLQIANRIVADDCKAFGYQLIGE